MGKLFDMILGGNEPATPAAPAVESPPIMPIPDENAMKEARRRSVAAQLRRRGRSSTILTEASDPVTGDSLG